jgi:hypothetical protein
VPSSDRGVLKTEETRVEDEVQVVGSTHSAWKPGNAGGGTAGIWFLGMRRSITRGNAR